MKRKIIYAALFLVLLAALIGPALYANKTGSSPQAADSPAAGETTESGKTVQEADRADANGVKPGGQQPDNGLSAGNTAESKEISPAVAGRGGDSPVQPAGAPFAGTEEEVCKAGVAVLGKDGQPLFGPADVTVNEKNRWGDTALGALDATGLPYSTKGLVGFVDAVAGQANKGQSGWMYQVNGEIPMVAADQTRIKAGYKVIWWYSRSMGDPTPDWASLTANRKE